MITILGPVIILLLFVFVFGGTLGTGLPGVDPNGVAGTDIGRNHPLDCAGPSALLPMRPEANAARGIRFDPSSGVLCGQSGLSRA
jgi:hypothetical protein